MFKKLLLLLAVCLPLYGTSISPIEPSSSTQAENPNLWKSRLLQYKKIISAEAYNLLARQQEMFAQAGAPKIADPSIKSIPIIESNEDLIDVRAMQHRRISMLPNPDHPFASPDHNSGFDAAAKIRKTLFQKLQSMIERLDQLAAEFGYEPGQIDIKVFEGLRDIKTQEHLFNSKAKEIGEANPSMTAEEIFAETAKWVSPVRNNVPVHSTGGAVDVRLWDNKNQKFLDMGPFGVIWGKNSVAPTFSEDLSDEQKKNRLLQMIVATEAGLTNYLYEYWHFSSGDRYASFWNNAESASYSSVPATEVRHLIPPQLSSAHLGTQIVCHRPKRINGPRIDIERSNGKIIINNHGHGSGGWTLGPGSGELAADLLDKEAVDHAQPIAIIGAGAIGLFSATELVERGYTNITIIADQFDDLTSHHAGGLFAPSFNYPNPKFIENLGCASFKIYARIAKKEHPFLTGARFTNSYFPTRDWSDLERFVGKVISPAKDVLVDFGTGFQRPMVVYDDNIFMDVGLLMHELTSFLFAKGVRFEQRHITTLDAVDFPTLVNCAGLGAKDLTHEEGFQPIQGHLIMLKQQNPEQLNYMLDGGMAANTTTSDGFSIKRLMYFMPKRLHGAQAEDVGVIGGTFINGADERTPHEEEFEQVLKIAKKYYGIMKEA